MNYFTFDGIDSRTYNTYIATSNAFDAPGREDEVIKVPGSNNIYYLTEGTYKPFDIKLYCYIPSNMQVKTDDLRNFLLTKGTCRYTEAIRPNEFRVARFIEAYELDVSDRVSAAFVLTFKAQPQRYLISNDPITTTATADTTTDTTMSLNTVPTPINISLNGNTTQEGSSGKNVFDYLAWANGIAGVRATTSVSGNNFTITATGADAHTQYGGTYDALFPRVTANTNYTFSWKVVSNTGVGEIYIFSESGSVITHIPAINNHYITFNSGESTYIKFRLGVTNSGTSITFTDLQFEKGSTATAYEPHISPTNPQVIHNVSGDNEIKVVNKNLFDIENDYVNTKFSLSGGTLFNTATDTRTYFFLSILALNGNTVVSVIYANSFSTTGEKSVTFNSGDLSNVTRLRLKHNGSSNDLEIAYVEKSSLTANTNYTLSFNLISNNPTTVNGLIISNIQLEKGSTATTYEPYTRQSYPLYLPVENIFNISATYTETTYVRKYTYVLEPNTQYTCSTNAPQYGSTANIYFNGGSSGSNGVSNGNPRTMTTDASGNLYVTVRHNPDSGAPDTYNVWTLINDGTYYLQIEKGTNANHYTPYGTTPIELNKIGTYQDYIYKNGGKWYVHKVFNTITLDGSSDENVRKNDTSTANYLYYWMGLPNIDATQLGYVYCNRLINTIVLDNINGGNGIINVGCAMRSVSSQAVFYFNVGVYLSDNTLATVKTWLASNPLTFIYPLRTATNTEITDTTLINQLNNIEKAYSYNGTTNILQVSNDNGFMLSVLSLHANNVSSTYKGEPIITVNSTGLIYFNGCVIKVNQAPMTINSQTMQAYNGVVNLNNYIEANDFPMIEAGTNVIGSEMPLSIVPNYWKL